MVGAGSNGGIVMLRCGKVCAAALLALAATPVAAGAQSVVRAGMLECRGIGSTQFIVGSVHEFECFYRAEDGRSFPYHGIIRRMGVDLGVTTATGLAWAVFAPTRTIAPGDLAGNYGGVAASAAVGIGAGANALMGGSNNTIALQPLSLEGQTGLNVAVGVAEFQLRYGR